MTTNIKSMIGLLFWAAFFILLSPYGRFIRVFTIIYGFSRYLFVLKRIKIGILLMILGVTTCYAQYDPSFSHYFDIEPSFNPGSVGKQAKLNVDVVYALDMAGFEHNPRTMYAAADMPFYALKNYHGVGVQFMNDQIGLFTHQKLALQYAFKKRLFKGMLSAGLQVGMLSESFDGSKVDLGESNDPAFSTSKVDGSGIDLGFGLYYSHGTWYVGVSGLHLNQPKIEMGETNEMQIDATYYLTG